MESLEDVQRLVGQLPETVETTKYGHRTWAVGGKGYDGFALALVGSGVSRASR